jgi:hypothetical protein
MLFVHRIRSFEFGVGRLVGRLVSALRALIKEGDLKHVTLGMRFSNFS